MVPWWRWTLAGWNKLAAFSLPRFPEEADVKGRSGCLSCAQSGPSAHRRLVWLLASLLGSICQIVVNVNTPRNLLGIPDYRREFAGAPLGDGEVEAIDGEALDRRTTPAAVL